MKKTVLFISFLSLLVTIHAQPEINCDTVVAASSESTYMLPYAIGKTYTVTQSNCFPNGGHNLTFAYDFNTVIGDTIIACRSGIVVFSNDQYADTDWTSGHENNVFIQHSDGTRIRYTHLMQGGALVVQNQLVEQGQPIGISGNSGNTGGFPHLHLSAFKDGSSYNRQNTIPLNFCNTNDPVNDQNLLIQGQSYTALDKNTTAVKESNFDDLIAVYPNPVSIILNIEIAAFEIDLKQIQLVNVNGKLVYSLNVKNNFRKLKIPVNGLPEGLYFLVMKREKDTIFKKILIF